MPVIYEIRIKSEGDRPEIDIPTLIAIATLAWVLVNVSHEIIGHAGAMEVKNEGSTNFL